MTGVESLKGSRIHPGTLLDCNPAYAEVMLELQVQPDQKDCWDCMVYQCFLAEIQQPFDADELQSISLVYVE